MKMCALVQVAINLQCRF